MSLSRLAKDLKPYIVPWIAAALNGGSSGGGGGGAVIGAHALDGAYHTGALASSQAPQFPLLAGGRTYTGNLVLVDGVLVDGIDLSEHAANPAAHHALVTAGDGIDVTGQAVAVDVTDFIDTSYGLTENANNIRISAGAGLTFAAGSLAVGAGDGITVNADDVALTTPGTLTVATTNAAAGSHTHAVTASADVGTTPAAALLKSTAAGGIILANLGVKGDIDVTDGGNLYVAGSIGGASGVMVTLDDRVGFGRIPDPQFTVDVNGPLRADYLIGQHAIQLKDALFIAHYDGGGDQATNFTGEANGHRGQVATISGTVAHVPGLFGKGVRLAAATTNQVANPSFETSATDLWGQTNAASISRDTLMAFVGLSSCKFAATTTFTQQRSDVVVVNNGETVTAQVRVYREFAADNIYTILYNNTDGANLVVTSATLTDEWELLTATWTNTTGSSKNVRFYLNRNDAGGSLGAAWFDAVQMEVGAATPYIDGTMPGGTWAGGTHSSATTATAAALTYATAGNVNFAEGTIMAWVMLPNPVSSDIKAVFRVTGASSTYIILRVGADGKPTALWGTASATGAATLEAGVWQHLAMTSDGRTLRLYVNGAEAASVAHDALVTPPSTFRVGWSGASTQYFNGLVDDLVIVSNALTAQKILSIYESDAPVFAESSVFAFRATPTGLVWADENGLWMRDVDGNHVLGVYGGEAVGNSWGGLTLGRGDLLIGRSPTGYVHWDESADTLYVSGAIDIQNPGDIGLDDIGEGTTYKRTTVNEKTGAGRGYSGLDSSGNLVTKALPGSNIGTPAGAGLYLGADYMGYYNGSAWKTYIDNTGKFFFGGATGATLAWDGTDLYGTNGTTVQWYARASTGKLYAGAGALTLDASGLSLAASGAVAENTSLTWKYSGSTIASLWAYRDFPEIQAGMSVVPYDATGVAELYLEALGNGSQTSLLRLQATGISETATIDLTGNGLGGRITFTGDAMRFNGPITAYDANGLSLQDDGGNVGLQVNDGGSLTLLDKITTSVGQMFSYALPSLGNGQTLTVDITSNSTKAYMMEVMFSLTSSATVTRWAMLHQIVAWTQAAAGATATILASSTPVNNASTQMVITPAAAIANGIRFTFAYSNANAQNLGSLVVRTASDGGSLTIAASVA